MTKCVSILSLNAFNPALNQLAEGLNLSHRALANLHGEEHRFFDDLPQANAILLGCLYDFANGCIANTTRGIVDDALKSLFVVRVGYQAEVCNHILYLLALIETQSAIDAIRNAILTHLFLKASALRVGTIKYGEVAPVAAVLTLQSLDVLRHNQRLLAIAISRLKLQALSVLVFREYILWNLSLVSLNQRVGCLYNQLSRTVVLLQFKQLSIVIQALKVQNIIDVCPTEAVDALCIIAHHAHLLALFGKLINNLLLSKIGILILIYEYKIEFINVFLADFLVILKQNPRLNQ